DHITHDAVDVAVPGGADLASHVHQAGGDHGLHRDPGVPVLDQQVVEDRVGDLVADLVGVPFGDRLGREGAQLAGGHGAQGTSARRPASSSITAWATSVLLPSDSARSSPRWSRIRTALSLEPKTPAVTSLKTSRSAPLRRGLARARARALLPSWPVSAATPTLRGRGDRARSTRPGRRMSRVRRSASAGTESSPPSSSLFLIFAPERSAAVKSATAAAMISASTSGRRSATVSASSAASPTSRRSAPGG